jgi:hypothetical protein
MEQDNCAICGRVLVQDGGGYWVCPDDSDEHQEKRRELLYGPEEG